MIAVAATAESSARLHRADALEKLQRLTLFLVGASSSLVFIEPSPYEFTTLLALAVFFITGFTLRPVVLLLFAALVLLNLGYSLSASSLYSDGRIVNWVVTSWYLAATAVLFAVALSSDTAGRLNALLAGILLAGFITAALGVGGYFRLVPGGADLLLLYDRARGTFKDPNVFGAFLVLPAMISLHRLIAGRFLPAVLHTGLLGLFLVGILLSFSRAAWGQVVFAGAMVLFFSLVTAGENRQRLRIVLLAGGGALAAVLLLAALISVGPVAELLEERLSLNQEYDVGEQGRFGRQVQGALLALESPFGLGPMQFSKIFPEDPHNSFLNAFVSGGWLSGLALPAIVLLTLVFGLRAVFAPTPWRSGAIVIYAAYLGAMLEGIIIDTDHWRHVFLLLGVQWGLIAATMHYRHRHDRYRQWDGVG